MVAGLMVVIIVIGYPQIESMLNVSGYMKHLALILFEGWESGLF